MGNFPAKQRLFSLQHAKAKDAKVVEKDLVQNYPF
jgi:hypothetical protein